MGDYQESVTTGQTDRQTDAGQSDPYVPLCFAGDTETKYDELMPGFEHGKPYLQSNPYTYTTQYRH